MPLNFAIDERDIRFVLFEHLKVQAGFAHPRYAGFAQDDADMILSEAIKFSKEQIAPTNAIGDTNGAKFKDGEVTLPEEFQALYTAFCEGGWNGLTTLEEMGGSNIPISVGMGCTEALVAGNVAFSTYPGLGRGVAAVIEEFGDDWQNEQVAKRLYAGEWSGTMCLTESQAGTAIGDIRSEARREGERWLMKGTKIFISGGEHSLAPNILHLVLARTPDAPAGIKGLSLFLVPKVRINPDGTLGEHNDVICSGIEEKMGLHGSCTCSLNFGDNDGCEALLVGAEGQGIQAMFKMMNEARILTGMHGLVGAALSYQASLAYAKERTQGVSLKKMKDPEAERVAIIEHPDVRRMLFTMKAQVEGMRALLFKAAYVWSESESHPDEAERDKNAKLLELLTPLCKSHCSDVGFDVTVTGIQVHGGMGYASETGVEQLARDVKVASIYEGANGIQALDLVGRKLTRNNGEYFMLFIGELNATLEELAEHPGAMQLAPLLTKERDRLLQVAGKMAEAGMSGDVEFPALIASPFLTMLSNVAIGWLFLQQAATAHDALQALAADKGAEVEALVAENDEAAYLANKGHTAAFFIKNLLQANRGLAVAAMGGHREILSARL